ncbi:26S proteasome non-ATPase regulatory subunit 4, partial [Tanacetum coccineum]
ADAIELYCEKKLKFHPDNLVGIFAMGATGFGSVPTQSLSKIMHGVLGVTLVGAHTTLRHALGLAQFRCFDFKNLLKRIVAFSGGHVYQYRSYSSDLGATLSQAAIGLDVVNYGTQQGEKTRILNGIVWNLRMKISDVAYLISHIAYTSLISSLLWEKVTEKEDEMIIMTCMGMVENEQFSCSFSKEKSANQGKNQVA